MIVLNLTRKEAYQIGIALAEFWLKTHGKGNRDLLDDVKAISSYVAEEITEFELADDLDAMDMAEVLYD